MLINNPIFSVVSTLMSPAAVDFRSPVTSNPSSLQNPCFAPSSAVNSADDHEHSIKSPIFGNTDEFGIASLFGLRSRSVSSGRPRTRLVKARRPLHGRPKGVSGEFGLGFNPFQSRGDSSNDANDYSSSSNGFFKKYMFNGNDYSRVSFVFGAPTSGCSSNSESLKRVIDANVKELSSKVESKISDNISFLFDDKQIQFKGNEENSVLESEIGKLANAGFVVGAKQSVSNENEGKPSSKKENGELHNVGFVLGASENSVEIKLDLKGGESGVCGFGSHSHYVGKVNEVQGGEDGSVGFESVADKRNFRLNLNFEREEASGSVAKPDGNNVGFIFGATDSNSSTNMWVSGAADSRFVFNNKESGGSLQNFISDDEEMKVEGEKAHEVNGTAVKFDINVTGTCEDNKVPHTFGSSSEKSSRRWMPTTSPDDVRSNTEYFESCSSITRAQNSNIDSSTENECELVSFENSRNVANASASNSVFNHLSDEMEKLNIDGVKNFGGGDNKKFVFRGNKMASAPCNRILKATSHERNSGLASAAKVTDSDQFETTDKDERNKVGSSGTFQFQAGLGDSSHGQLIDDTQLNGAAAPSWFSSISLNSQGNVEVPEPPPMAWVGKENDEISYTSTSDRLGMLFTDFETPKWDPSCLKESLFPELNGKLEFSVKSNSKKDKKSKTTRGKLKQLSQNKQRQGQVHMENESSAQDILNSPGCYSPMDFSPYEDTTIAEKISSETLRTSDDSVHLDNDRVSVLHSTVPCSLKDRKILDLETGDERNAESSAYHSRRCSCAEPFVFELAGFGCNTELVCGNTGGDGASTEDISGLNSESIHHIQFDFASGLEDIDGSKFSFSASAPAPDSSISAKRPHRKKNRKKVPCEPFVITAKTNVKDQEGDLSSSQRKLRDNSEANEQVKRGSISSTAAIQEACETWRLRGNHAYKDGDLSKAEDFYTRGIDSVPSNETSGCCLRPLVICYSNRAATRMALGNMREALRDCAMAAALDPRFLKVQMRAGNCHLALGEVEKAQYYFHKCLESGAGVCLDRRITIEAADGLQKAQKVAECINQSTKFLEQQTTDAALGALDVIADALPISPYAEELLQMKAESMFLLQKYEEVIQLCELTLCTAEKNFASSGVNEQSVDKDCSQTGSHKDCSQTGSHPYSRLWRWLIILKSNFYLGRLAAALDLLEKLEQRGSISERYPSKILESSVSLAVIIRALFHHKNAGNEAVRSGRYKEALEHYTAAISSNVESHPFAAICFCNRAAAYQALGQITDAIADCSLAIALDGNYSKAVSRRATLHEMIRDYEQAASDVRRLITILENPSDGTARQSAIPGSPSLTKELRQARRRLSLIEKEARKGIPLDIYLILGLKQSDTAADMKRAYRKAALRHHPDKACQFLAKSESGDAGRLWRDIVPEVHKDADRLFKMIGEAYAVLSDPTKRSQYDLDDEIIKASKENSRSYPPRRTSDGRNYACQRNWQDNWKTHDHSYSRW